MTKLCSTEPSEAPEGAGTIYMLVATEADWSCYHVTLRNPFSLLNQFHTLEAERLQLTHLRTWNQKLKRAKFIIAFRRIIKD